MPALIMLDTMRDFGLSTFEYTTVIAVGNLLKSALTILAAGKAIDRFGAHRCAWATLAAVLALVFVITAARSRLVFCTGLVGLVTVTAFAEQPCFICLNATHFKVLASVATSSLASAFSIGGAVLPLLLAPLLADYGWRTALRALALGGLVLLPLLVVLLQPGTIAVGSMRRLPAKAAALARGKATATAAPGEVADTRAPSGVSTAQALRSAVFWALWLAAFLHLTYGSFLSGQLTTALRLGSRLDVVAASSVNALQFFSAIGGKLASGALLSHPGWATPVRLLLFILAPIAYCGSHLLLLDIHITRLAAGEGLVAVGFATGLTRLRAYAVCVGLPFGLIFGTLQCLPARLFGHRDLPTLQSATYSAILLSSACTGSLVGFLADTFHGFEVPLLCTFGATFVQIGLLLFLMRADVRAEAAARAEYEAIL